MKSYQDSMPVRFRSLGRRGLCISHLTVLEGLPDLWIDSKADLRSRVTRESYWMHFARPGTRSPSAASFVTQCQHILHFLERLF